MKQKPGCVPPYVALNMPSEHGNIEAERIYLDYKEKHPRTADIRYMFMGIRNILGHRITSA